MNNRSHLTLIIVFNHRYDNNIAKLEKIYRKNFSNIKFLVPFYNGDREDVIPIYENSHYFQGYFAQGYHRFFNEDTKHYMFVADDMILNPHINEDNYADVLQLKPESSFLPFYNDLHCLSFYWMQIEKAYRFSIEEHGVEIKKEIPSYLEALDKFKANGLEIKPLSYIQIFGQPVIPPFALSKAYITDFIRYFRKWSEMRMDRKYTLNYPLVGGYSDFIVVSSHSIKEFCRLCGIFASAALFVELAIPTSLVLSSHNIKTEKDIRLKGRALWTQDEMQELDCYERKLEKLLSQFPENQLYYHPIKLSNWNYSIS